MLPKVSVIITSYQRLDYIANLIDSIINYTAHPNFEVIIVNTDPGYNKLLDDFISKLPSLTDGCAPVCKTVHDGVKRQFMEGVEAGYLISEGEYIQILNDDMLIPSNQMHWLQCMQDYLMRHDECATCSLYQYLDGQRLYTIGETDINKPGHTCGRFRHKLCDLPEEKETLWNNFSCVMLQRDFIEQHRFLDVVPKPQYHYGSDSCYCRMVIEEGYKNILINKAWVYHFNNRLLKGRYDGKYVYTGH